MFGGVPRLAINAITGGLYKPSPEQVTAQLQKSGPQVAAGGRVLLVTVVMNPTAKTERIGTLVTQDQR